jgi:hypothetical protein
VFCNAPQLVTENTVDARTICLILLNCMAFS